MYLRKSPRCVLSKFCVRGLRASPARSRPRWPEDDPTKPPLRLNIPRDSSGPSQLTQHITHKWDGLHGSLFESTLAYEPEGTETGIQFASPPLSETKREKSLQNPASATSNVKPPREAPTSQATPEEVSPTSRLRKNYKVKRLRRRDLTGAQQKVDDRIRILMDSDAEHKKDVLTIKIGLGDQVEGVDEYSKEYITSSGEIQSLAEAIVRDLRPHIESKSDADEACIVVINVVDRDDVGSEKTASGDVKVRDSGLSNDVDNVLFKTDGANRYRGTQELPRHKPLERKEFRGLSYVAPVQTEATLVPPPSPRKPMSPRSTQTARTHTKSRVLYLDASSKDVKFAAKTKPAMVTKTQTQHLVEARVTRPIEYASDREMRMRPKMEPENYIEKKVDNSPASRLKPLSRKITVIDDAPEKLRYPEYKYTPLRHTKTSMDDDVSSVKTIRRYHISCLCDCKLTEGVGDDKPRLVMLDKDVAKNEKAPINRILSPDRVRLAKGEASRKGGTAKVSDLKSGTDVYLQEGGDAIGDLARTDSVDHAPNEASLTATLSDGSDGRYETDMTDVRRSAKAAKRERKNCGDVAALSEEEFALNRSCLETRDAVAASNTPKMSDHIVNLANEDLTNAEADRGANSVDSLSMMKRVKEIVDMDLKNAEKIFVTSQAKGPPEDPSGTDKSSEEIIATTDQTVPNTGENMSLLQGPPPYPVKSVIIYDELTNTFYLQADELEAMARQLDTQLLSPEESLLKMIDPGKPDFSGDLSVFMDVPPIGDENKTLDWVLKSGDSIVFYDEETNTYRVDFNVLKDPPRVPDPILPTPQPFDVSREQQRPTADYPPAAPEKPTFGKQETTETPVVPPHPAQKPPPGAATKIEKSEMEKRERKLAELKRRVQRDSKEVDAQEIRKQNSDLYENVFVGIKKAEKKTRKEEETQQEQQQQQPLPSSSPGDGKPPKKAADATGQRYVSDNIVEMSKASALDKAGPKIRLNKIETMKVKMTPVLRPPLKVTEINLNKKCDEAKDKDEKGSGSDEPKKRKPQTNGAFYKKFEKYKSPFSDPEYEEKPMKINSDLESNPNLKKLDSWNKTLVLQEFAKSSPSSSPDNIENWLKDETDKMATLLLKVLQDAADGSTGRSRRSTPKSSGSGAGTSRGNPYEAIRKKQEKSSGKRKKEAANSWQPSRVFEEIRIYGKASPTMDGKNRGLRRSAADDWSVEVLHPEGHLSKEAGKSQGGDDIPGPDFLKRFTSFWKFLPELGCQATIFLLIRMYQMVKTGSSFLSTNVSRMRSDPFGHLFTKYGPVVKLRGFLSGDVVLINRPEDVSNVFAQSQSSPGRSVMDSVENCRSQVKERNFPVGITDSWEGDYFSVKGVHYVE